MHEDAAVLSKDDERDADDERWSLSSSRMAMAMVVVDGREG